MTQQFVAGVLLFALLLQFDASSQAPSDAGLKQGISQVQDGDLEAALLTLDGVVRRLSQEGGLPQDLAFAYLYLGMAQLGLNQSERARASIRSAAETKPDLVLTPEQFPPRVIEIFEQAKRELPTEEPPRPRTPSSARPSPASGGGGKKVALIALGVAATAGVAALILRKNPLDTDDDGDGFSENQGDCNDHAAAIGPRGQFTLANARFESTVSNCPRGTNSADTKVVLIDATNNTCTSSAISSASVALTYETASGTFNVVGQTLTFDNSPFSPNTVAGAGGGAVVRVTAALTCTNGGGNPAAFNVVRGRVTVQTSAGAFTLTTSNTARTNFP